MTKKDYELIAQAIAGNTQAYDNDRHILKKQFVEDLSNKLQLDNPKFDRNKFIIACSYPYHN